MVMIMVTSWYPPGKAAEVGKKFIEVAKAGFRLNPIGCRIACASPLLRATSIGIKSYTLIEVDKGRLEEVLNRIARIMVEFHGIEGYRYEIETLLTGEEGMPLVGLEMPAV